MNIGRLAEFNIRFFFYSYSNNLRLNGRDLPLCFGTLLQFRHLLALYRRSDNLLSKNDVTNFAGRQ